MRIGHIKMTPEEYERAWHFLKANFTNEDLRFMRPSQMEKFLRQGKKDWKLERVI